MEQIKVTTTGSAGSATGDATSELPINGVLWGVYLNYHASAPATTDVTIKAVLPDGVEITIFTLNNSATDAYKPIRIANVDASNTALTTYDPFLFTGQKIKVSVAGCDALTNAVIVTPFIMK
jgi:hypothetical protein